MNQEFDQLLITIKEYSESADLDKIRRAWEFAKLSHTGQKRLSGEKYASHPLAVATILVSWRLDVDSLVAGLLHDTVEDGGATREDLITKFGEDVSLLVDGVTNVASLRLRPGSEERFAENLRKMVLFMAKDIRVVLIKIADRLHNMRTLWAVPKEKQLRIAQETLDLYAPLSERLGMGKVKGELEDLAFEYADPENFKKVIQLAKSRQKTAEEHITKMKHVLLRRLADEGIRANINGRKKHLYSLFKKLERVEIDWDFEKIHDIVALRILVDTVAQCYVALGVVHSSFKPVPQIGVSDFIAQPKPNGYQSIHTKVFGPMGKIVEVQIRTYGMHEQAENGIAAHWAYALAKSKGVTDKILENEGTKVKQSKLSWVKQLVEWQKELTDSKQYLEAVKFDALNNRNFVFSPKGDVYDLPQGATPVDYAYNVHTTLAQYINSAKVNGKIVPLSYKLKSGDVVEIMKSKNAKKPNRDWLEFVATTAAKREISKQLRKSQ